MNISVSTILHGFRTRWMILVGAVLVLWTGGIVYLLITPTLYAAGTEFYYVDLSQGSESQGGGGIASIAASVGLSTPRGTGREIAVAILQSRQIARDFVQKYKLLPILFPEHWDAGKKAWSVSPDKVPTVEAGAAKLAAMLKVDDDPITGVLTAQIRFTRQDLVAPMANNFVSMTDDVLRKRALDESKESLDYLEQQVIKTSMTELRTSITDLMEHELQRITLTQTRGRFAFKVIDPAITPTGPVWPRRGLLMAILTFLGIVGGGIISIILDLRKTGMFA